MNTTHDTAPFDSTWVSALADLCNTRQSAGATFIDLYLGRRLETTVSNASGTLQVEECRAEGSAVRWSHPSRLVLRACSGIAPEAIHSILSPICANGGLTNTPPLVSHDQEVPEGWRDWAQKLCDQLLPRRTTVRFISTDAIVVRPGKWIPVRTPPLLRVELSDRPEAALLAVWGNPKIGSWLTALVEPSPSKTWDPPSGAELPIVFTDGTFGVLMHELVGHMLEMDVESDQDSPFRSLRGATVSSPTLSIVDDPTRFDLAGAFSADDEGIPAEPQDLLREGRVVGALSDRVAATRHGLPPGRGRRSNWTRHPQPRMSNLVVTPGTTTDESLEADQRHGLVVTQLAGAIADPVSGRVVLRVARGWELHNGRRRRSLASCELTGSVLQILAAIDPSLGNDPSADWRLGWCVKDGAPVPTGSVAPSALIHCLAVL
ncbi:MAG: TldD/PmbA family protein [bacterium]|nr:TldD/PmbA family protein [bacterium]